jgi:hypothetical protein
MYNICTALVRNNLGRMLISLDPGKPKRNTR